MNPVTNAIALGIRRGWHEFVIGLRSPSDQGFYVMFGLGSLALLWFNRDEDLGIPGLTLPQLLLPSILAAILMFSIVITPAYALALERKDGTVLRLRVGPYGLHGYLVGLMTLTLVSILPLLVIVLGGSALLFEGAVPRDPATWALIAGTLLLGILANLPLGFVIGSLVTKLQQVTTWGMAPTVALAYLSGIFGDMERLWGWVQVLAQLFPLYWFGHLMRFAFLPEAAAAAELTGGWRVAEAVAVLAVWAVVGFALAIPLVRRMSRRQSGAAVAEARDQAANQPVR